MTEHPNRNAAPPPAGKVLIVGVGNDYRRDDGAGWQVARTLVGRQLPGVSVCESSGDAAGLLDLWTGATRVWVVDAVSSGKPPGTVQVLDARCETIPRELFCCSSHAFGVAEAIALGQALGQLPDHLRVVVIEGQDFGTGQGLTSAVTAGVAEAADRICVELEGGPQPCMNSH